METFASLPPSERRIVFEQTTYEMGIAPIIIEKDFWVCWILDKVFSLPSDHPALLFKGGTSLSKVFNLIGRFSEDIDLSIDRVALGFVGERDPLANKGKARRRLLQELTETANTYVSGDLLYSLREIVGASIGATGEDWTLSPSPDAADVLIFTYPASLDEYDYSKESYVRPAVRLELGARSDQFPTVEGEVRPYVASEFPEDFTRSTTNVQVLDARRTFWEKATILHSLANGGLEQVKKGRRSRHYYDLFELAKSDFREAALVDIDLLETVACHKQVYFPAAWARYETAKVGTLQLVPDEGLASELERDYQSSRPMFFEDPPSFQAILKGLAELEREINSLSG